MVQIWESYKPLQLISSINTDHALFICRGKPVLPFSEKFSRCQKSEILWCLNVIALPNSYMYIRSLQVEHGLVSIFSFQDCFYITLLIIMSIRMSEIQYWKCYNICNTWKIKGRKTKNLNMVHLIKHINGYFLCT